MYVYDGVRIATHRHVYDPSDDSWLLARHSQAPGQRVVDVGCGTGLAGLVAARSGGRVVSVDVNPLATRLTRENAVTNGIRVDVVTGDALRMVRWGAVDLVLCNPPYLPTSADERIPGPLNAALDGGPQGLDFISRLLASLRGVDLRPGFEVKLVASTLQGRALDNEVFEPAGFLGRVLESVRLPFERLDLWRLTPAPSKP